MTWNKTECRPNIKAPHGVTWQHRKACVRVCYSLSSIPMNSLLNSSGHLFNWSAQCFSVVLSNLQYKIDVFLWCNICSVAWYGCALLSSLSQGSVSWNKRPTHFRSLMFVIRKFGLPGLVLRHCRGLFPSRFFSSFSPISSSCVTAHTLQPFSLQQQQTMATRDV